jgi:hypothetical protein
MMGVPWFSTMAEHEEFAEKPNKGRFSSPQIHASLISTFRHVFWRFNTIMCRH